MTFYYCLAFKVSYVGKQHTIFHIEEIMILQVCRQVAIRTLRQRNRNKFSSAAGTQCHSFDTLASSAHIPYIIS